MIHPTAIVDAKAEVAGSAQIGPYCVLEAGVKVGPDCVLKSHVVLRAGTQLQQGVSADSFSVIGGDPQSLNFDIRQKTGVLVESGVVIREGVTIHRATKAGTVTRIGKEAFLMANAHVAHDCTVGAHTVMANGCLLGGHVEVGPYCNLSGGAVFHQGIRLGESVMVSGNSRITQDVPPFIIACERNQASVLNLVGLKRRGFAPVVISDLKKCFQAVYLRPGSLAKNAALAIEEGIAQTDQGKQFLVFFENSPRGRFVQYRKA